jgi:hypothetical protein
VEGDVQEEKFASDFSLNSVEEEVSSTVLFKRHNVSMICEISSSHGGEYDVQSCLLGYTAV